MSRQSIYSIERTIAYIEEHLDGKLDLDRVADAMHYSKYHLHRTFTDEVGMTIHDYIFRRQLTEAAKLFLDKLMEEILPGQEICTTTYREGDRADNGHRKALMNWGFAERELLFEFGYPTQKFVLSSVNEEDCDENLSAINIVTPMLSLTVGLGTMLAAGGNAVISRNMGEGYGRLAKENFTLIISSGAVSGMVLAGAVFMGMKELLFFLGAKGVLYSYAGDYLGILIFFLPAYMLQTIFANLFVTAGHPGLGTALSVSAGILNIVLDYVFIVIFPMGIKGAALGTGLGVLFMVFGGLIFFRPEGMNRKMRIKGRERTLYFCRTSLRLEILWESIINGSSEMAGQLSAAVTTLLFNLSMLRLAGRDGVAAITIMNYLQFLFHGLYIGFSMGTAPVIGWHYGKLLKVRNRFYDSEEEKGVLRLKPLKRIIGFCLRFVLAASVCVFGLSFLGAKILVGIFTGGSGTVYGLAAGGMKLFSISFLFSGFNIFISAMFTALSNGKTSAFLSFLRTFVFLTAAILILPRFLGLTGVWLAAPAAELTGALSALGALLKAGKEIR